MNSSVARNVVAAAFVVLAAIIGAAALRSTSAMYTVLLTITATGVALAAMMLLTYVVPPPGSVIVVFGQGTPRVLRRGSLMVPGLASWTALSIVPVQIESNPAGDPRATDDWLITKDGFPVRVNALVSVAVRDDDDSIRKAAILFGDKSVPDVEQHFRKQLRAHLAGAVARSERDQLKQESTLLMKDLEKSLSLEQDGYQLRVAKIGDVAPGDAEVLKGADKIQATRALADLKHEANKEEHRRTDELAKQLAENNTNTQTRNHDAELQRLRNTEAVKGQTSKDTIADLGRQAVELPQKRIVEALQAANHREQETTKAATDWQTGVLRAAAESDALGISIAGEADRLRSALAVAKERLAVREIELSQNTRHPLGDLGFVLKKEIVQAATEAGRQQVQVLADALRTARVTVLTDPAALGSLAKDVRHASTAGVRIGEEMLALDDVSQSDVVTSMLLALTASHENSHENSHRSSRPPTPPQRQAAADARANEDSEFEP